MKKFLIVLGIISIVTVPVLTLASDPAIESLSGGGFPPCYLEGTCPCAGFTEIELQNGYCTGETLISRTATLAAMHPKKVVAAPVVVESVQETINRLQQLLNSLIQQYHRLIGL